MNKSPKNSRSTITSLLAVGLLPIAVSVYAAKPQINGFVSQGFVYSSENPVYQEDTGGHFDFRELGVNTTWQATNHLRFAAQAISRKLGELDDGSPKLDFALLDYSVNVGKNSLAGIRLGRVKNQYGLYNSTRDVPHARPGVLTPQSVYFETFRDALLSVDGFNVYFTNSSAWGEISINAYNGKTDIESEVIEVQIFSAEVEGGFEDADISGFSIAFTPSGVSGFSLVYSLLDASMELEDTPIFTPEEQLLAGLELFNDPLSFTNYITSTKIEPKLNLLSSQFSRGDWVFTGEYLLVDITFSDVEVLGQPMGSDEFQLRGYYLQAEWLFNEEVSFYSRFEDLVYNIDDKRGQEFADAVGGNPVTQYTQSYTVGARWYITPDFSLSGEYSKNEGTAFINGPESIDYQSLVEDWDLLLLQMSYHF